MKIDPEEFRAPSGTRVRLDQWPTDIAAQYRSKKRFRKHLAADTAELSALQRLLYAAHSERPRILPWHDPWPLTLVRVSSRASVRKRWMYGQRQTITQLLLASASKYDAFLNRAMDLAELWDAPAPRVYHRRPYRRSQASSSISIPACGHAPPAASVIRFLPAQAHRQHSRFRCAGIAFDRVPTRESAGRSASAPLPKPALR